jgi:hypothetical protein
MTQSNGTTKRKLPQSVGVRASFAQDSDLLKDAVIKKKADIDHMFAPGGSDTVRTPITYVDPLFDPVLTLFPKENIRELNRRLRHYYTYHPIVRNVINTHVEFSLCDFELSCSDSKIAKIYNDMKEELGLTELLMQAGRDYFLLGEAYLYGQWSNEDMAWTSFLQYPPENIEIFKTYAGTGVLYMLKPDDDLRKVLSGSSAQSKAIAQSVPADFRESVLSGKPYLLSNSNMIHFANRPAAYVPRGTSIVTSVLKYLLMEDKLLLLLLTNIDRNMTPIKLWKLGDQAKGLMPTKRQINDFRTLLLQAQSDPDFNIVTHPFVSADFVTPVGKLEGLMPYFEFIYKRILIGLFASDEFLKGSTSPYATASVSARLVMQRYLAFRTRVENIVRQRIFKPIAYARNFIDKETGDLMLPVLKWKSRNLLNEASERDLMMRLRDKGEIPFKVIADIFGLDVNFIKEELEKEQATVLDPIWRDALKEKSKDKGISREFVKGTKIPKAMEEGKEEDERITKPGRPSLDLGSVPKLPSMSGTPGLSGIPPRSAPIELGKEVKPMGGEAPVGPGGPTPSSPASPAGPTPEKPLV